MSKNLRGLSGRKGLKTGLFEEIGKIGSTQPDERDIRLKEISEEYLVGESSVLGTSSFYDFLKRENVGNQVFISDGTACLTSCC